MITKITLTNLFLKKFDIFLCPIDLFNKINEIKLDLAVNCFSLGEMSKKNFLDYIHSNLIKNARYFFSINRIFLRMNMELI